MACMVAKYRSPFSNSRSLAAAVAGDPHQLPPAAGSEEERKSFCSQAVSCYLSPPPPPPPSPPPPPAPPARLPAAVGKCNGLLPRSCSAPQQSLSPPSPPRLPTAWWDGQLAEGIHRTLQEREKLLDTVKLASPQLHNRADLIDFTSNICKYLPFSDTTRHLAVLLMDHFMEKHSIMEYRLKLVALTCLLVAAKLEDRDDYLPTIGHLRSLAKVEKLAEYSRDNFQRMELYLMKFFGWSISYPTSAHFVGYYAANSFHDDSSFSNNLPLSLGGEEGLLSDVDFLDCVSVQLDLMDSVSMLEGIENEIMEGTSGVVGRAEGPQGITTLRTLYNREELLPLRYQLEEITASLLEKALRDYRFLQYPPSMVAAGAVCVARTYMKALPVWTMRLEGVSGYTRQLINPVVELFMEQSP